MSFIPSFILSALIFCNAKVPGGWGDASFTEGIICEVPCTDFTLSFEETRDEPPSLKNAAVIYESDALSLKLAAGSLAVTGTGGSDRLSAALPQKGDPKKPLSCFASWQGFSTYYCDGRLLIQLWSGRSDTPVQNALSAGWTHIEPTKDDSWYLRYPWHTGGNLHSLQDSLTVRFPLSQASITASGTLSLSLPDMLAPAAGGALNLLLKAGKTESTLSVSAFPAHFMTNDGSFTDELLNAKTSFAYSKSAAGSQNKAESAFKAAAGIAVKQPAAAHELAKRFFSASASYSYKKGDTAWSVAMDADKFCLEENWCEGTLSPAAELTLFQTVLSLKGKILPFQDKTSDTAIPPELSVKVSRTHETMYLSYTAIFSGSGLETQIFSLRDSRDSVTLNTDINVKHDGISWELSFSKSW